MARENKKYKIYGEDHLVIEPTKNYKRKIKISNTIFNDVNIDLFKINSGIIFENCVFKDVLIHCDNVKNMAEFLKFKNVSIYGLFVVDSAMPLFSHDIIDKDDLEPLGIKGINIYE